MSTEQDEAHAWLAFTRGKNCEAIHLLRGVADKQDVEGKGEVALPAREMLADMLLEMGRVEDALVEYEKSISVDPAASTGYMVPLALQNYPISAKRQVPFLPNCSETALVGRTRIDRNWLMPSYS